MKRPWTIRLSRAFEDARDFTGDLLVNRRVRPLARREMAKRSRRRLQDVRAWFATLRH